MTRPTSEQIIDYVGSHPGCTSKDIAAHYKCTPRSINRTEGTVPGIYAIPEIRSDNYRHFMRDTYEDVSSSEEQQQEINLIKEELERLREENQTLLSEDHEQEINMIRVELERLQEENQILKDHIAGIDAQVKIKTKGKPRVKAKKTK